MQNQFPVGKAQSMVLEALGLTADNFDHANAIFARIGISVSSKRAGRSVVPVVSMNDTVGGGFNAYGEGETWTVPTEKIDLTPIEQWCVVDGASLMVRRVGECDARQPETNPARRRTAMQNMTPDEIKAIRQYGLDLIAEREQIIREQEKILVEARRFNHQHDITMAEQEIAFRQEEIADIRAKLAELEA